MKEKHRGEHADRAADGRTAYSATNDANVTLLTASDITDSKKRGRCTDERANSGAGKAEAIDVVLKGVGLNSRRQIDPVQFVTCLEVKENQ